MSEYDFGRGPVPAHRHPNGGGWVADTARVSPTVYVGPNAQVYGNARVYGGAQVYGNARVYGHARVYGKAHVYGDAQVYGSAWVYSGAWVCGNAQVYGHARVYGKAHVHGDARATKNPKVLTGFKHAVTVTDHHVAAGCEMHPPSVWIKRGAAIVHADGVDSETAKEWAAIINAIAEAHGCTDLEEE